MPDKDLHDIKIDELDSPKKTPLKNILTLLALLFIILVISVVITKLILNTDEGSTIENNDSKIALSNQHDEANKSTSTDNGSTSQDDDKKEEAKKEEITTPILAPKIMERNLTSVIKTPLTSHAPKKEAKRDIKEIKTYKTPKKQEAPKRTSNNVNHAKKVVQHTKREYVKPKRQYADKVVMKKEVRKAYIAPKKVVSHKTTTHTKSRASYLGGYKKKVTHSYYIKVGTYRDPSTIIRKIKKNNFNYSIVKVENDKTLMRVLVGPFFSRKQATAQLSKVKASILTGAYVTKVQ